MRRTRKPIDILKDKAWAKFARYIKLRDCLRTTGTLNRGKCITCNTFIDIEFEKHNAHAGHFRTGRHSNTKFDEHNVHLQCFGCNNMQSGNLINYFTEMEKLYGRQEVDRIIRASNVPIKFSEDDYNEIIEQYTKKIEQLEG